MILYLSTTYISRVIHLYYITYTVSISPTLIFHHAEPFKNLPLVLKLKDESKMLEIGIWKYQIYLVMGFVYYYEFSWCMFSSGLLGKITKLVRSHTCVHFDMNCINVCLSSLRKWFSTWNEFLVASRSRRLYVLLSSSFFFLSSFFKSIYKICVYLEKAK